MDDDHLESGTPGPVPAESVPVPAAPMGRGFWAAMILIGVLILLIIYAQVQGVTRSIPVNLTGTSWTLTYYESSGETMVPVMNGTKVNISFGLDNGTSLGGYSGCNWYRFSVHYQQFHAFSHKGSHDRNDLCRTRRDAARIRIHAGSPKHFWYTVPERPPLFL